jgi:hypothetical protein
LTAENPFFALPNPVLMTAEISALCIAVYNRPKITADNIIYDTRNSHPLFEIHFITEGENLLEIEGNTLLLLKDDYCIIKPGKFHSHIKHQANKAVMFPMRFHFLMPKEYDKMAINPHMKSFVDMLQNETPYTIDHQMLQ